MKRFLATLLCAMLLLGFLPAVSLPAKMLLYDQLINTIAATGNGIY